MQLTSWLQSVRARLESAHRNRRRTSRPSLHQSRLLNRNASFSPNRLGPERLEDRTLLTTDISFAANVLTIAIDSANETTTVSVAGTSLSITSDSAGGTTGGAGAVALGFQGLTMTGVPNTGNIGAGFDVRQIVFVGAVNTQTVDFQGGTLTATTVESSIEAVTFTTAQTNFSNISGMGGSNVDITTSSSITINQFVVVNSGGSLDLTTNDIAINTNVFGSGPLRIDDFTADTPISVGSAASSMNIDETEFGNLQDGFLFISIGNTTTGDVLVTGNLAPNDPLNVFGNTIDADGSLDMSDNDLLLQSRQDTRVLGATITTSNGDIDIEGHLAGGAAFNFDGVLLDTGTIETTGSGDISIRGVGPNNRTDFSGVFQNAAVLQSTSAAANAGSISIEGTGGGGTGSQKLGVSTQGTITTISGDVLISGSGGSSGSENHGVNIGAATIQSTGTGINAASIIIDGTGGDGTMDNIGVLIDDAGASITSVDGVISITGQGGSGLTAGGNHGISIDSNPAIDSTGSGSITLDGTGGTGFVDNLGLNLGTVNFNSINADMAFIGQGGTGSQGIDFDSNTFTSTGLGSISVLGTGGTGADDITGATLIDVQIQTVDGDITIEGTGGSATGSDSEGVVLIDGEFRATGAGNITINGTGSSGPGNDNHGVDLRMGVRVAVADGDLTVSGIGDGADGNGVYSDVAGGGNLVSSGAGTISITGSSNAAGGTGIHFGENTIVGDGTGLVPAEPAAFTGDIIFTADTITFEDSLSVQSPGNLTVRPIDSTLTMGVGTGATGTLNLDDAELTHFVDGFASRNFGQDINLFPNNSPSLLTVEDMTLVDPTNFFGVGVTLTGAIDTVVDDLQMRANRTLTLANSSSILTTDANVTLEANLAVPPVEGNFDGIVMDIFSSVTTDGDGDIVLTGRGSNQFATSNHTGIELTFASISSTGVAATAGTITLDGTGGAGDSDNYGVHLTVGSMVNSVSGDIQISGAGGVGIGANNDGVFIESGTIESTGMGMDTAAITINGNGGAGTNRNAGVELGAGSIIRSIDGDITIDGTGGVATGTTQRGVFAQGLIESTGIDMNAAAIDITGIGGSGTNDNDGVYVSGAAAIIQSQFADITLDGTGSGSGQFNTGVTIIDSAGVFGFGTDADVTIDGISGDGLNPAGIRGLDGVRIENNAFVGTADGTLDVTGSGGLGSDDGNFGVYLAADGIIATENGTANVTGIAGTNVSSGIYFHPDNGHVIANGAGTLFLQATGNGNSDALRVLGNSLIGDGQLIGAPNPASGDITIFTDTITLAPTVRVQSTGELNVSSENTGVTAGIGDSAVGTLNLDPTELATLQDGFTVIQIGDGFIDEMDINASMFLDPVVFDADGTINVTQLDAGLNSVTITSQSADILDGGDAGIDITGTDLFLFAAGDIGASGDAITLQVDNLTSDTTVGPGEQYLIETDTLEIQSVQGGVLNIEGGEFDLSMTDAIAPLTGLAFADDPTAILDLNGFDQTVQTLNGGGATGGTIDLRAGTFTVDGVSTSTFDGAIIGTGNLLHAASFGSARLILGGTNTYTGTTTASNDLRIDGSITSDVTFNGVELSGTGTIFGSVTETLGIATSVLAPGPSTGILTVGGDVTFATGQTFDVELNSPTPGTGHDQLLVTGATRTVALNNATLSLDDSLYTHNVGDSFIIIDNVDPSSIVVGEFDLFPDGLIFNLAGKLAEIDYQGGDGNDVEIRAITQSVSVTVAPMIVDEESGTAMVYTFTRNNTIGDVLVNFEFSGTAKYSDDFLVAGADSITTDLGGTTTGTITIPDTMLTAQVSVTPQSDAIVEGNETVIVSITSGADYAAAIPDSATGTIDDNDTATVSISATTTVNEESGAQDVTFTLDTDNGFGGSAVLGVNVTADLVDGGGGSAVSGFDYQAISELVLFAPGSGDGATSTAQITPIDDPLVEGDESINLTLQNVSPLDGQAFLGTTSGTATIDDNDTAQIEIVASQSVTEEGGAQTVSAQLVTSNGLGGTATLATGVTFSAEIVDAGGGSAGSGTDYAAPGTQVVSFSAGDGNGSSDTISLSPISDSLVEGNETLNLVLQNLDTTVDGQVSIVTAPEIVTIDDNDTAEIRFGLDITINEEGGSQNVLVFLDTDDGFGGGATLATGIVISADVVVSGGTAIDGTDYTTFGTQSVMFTGANPDGDLTTQPVTIDVTNDTLVEGNETVDLLLQNLSTTLDGQASLGDSSSTTTIDDNDTATLSVDSTTTVTEEGGTQTITVTLNTDDGSGGAATLAPGITLTADIVDAISGTAISATDFDALNTQSVSFTAGDSDGAVDTVDITPVNDAFVEGDETLTVTLQNLNNMLNSQAMLGTTSGSLTIDDNDTATFSIATSTTIGEDDGAQPVTVTLNTSDGAGGTATLGVGVDVSVDVVDATGGTATDSVDYTTLGTLTAAFISGDGDGATTTVSVTPTADTEIEPDETINVALQNIGSSLASPTLDGQLSIAAGSGVVIIDDEDTPNLTLTVDTTTLTEDSGSGFVFTITRDEGFANTATVNFTASGTTTAFDYMLSGHSTFDGTNGTVILPAGQPTVDLTVTPNNDAFVEGDETLQFTLTPGFGYILDTPSSASVTIEDDDTAMLSIQPTKIVTEEGGAQSVRIDLIAKTGAGDPAFLGSDVLLTADVVDAGGGTATDGTDYATFGTKSVTFDGAFLEGDGSSKTVSLMSISDALVEGDETINLTLENLNDTVDGQASLGTTSSVVTIEDNDTATLAIEAAPTLSEGGGTQTVTVTLTTSDGFSGTATLAPGVTITADVVDATTGTAASGGDFTALTTQTVTFAPGAGNNATQTVSIDVVEDTLVEGNETIDLTLQNLMPGLDGQALFGNTASSVTIDDNDTASLSIDPAVTALEESGTQSVAVTLTTDDGSGGTATLAPGISLTVDVVDATGGTAISDTDYTAIGTQTLTFAAGSGDGEVQNATVTALSDALVEGDESVNLTLQNLSSMLDSQASLGTASSIVTIEDNDSATLSIDVATTVTEEGGTQNIVVTLTTSDGFGGAANLAPGIALSADVVDAMTGTALSGTDYAATGTQVVTFATGSGDGDTQTVSLNPTNDTLVEGNESVDLTLQNLSAMLDGQAVIGTASGVVTVDDNDTAQLSIDATPSVSEEGGPQTVSITLTTTDGAGGTATLATGVTLTADVIDNGGGSALSGVDYSAFGIQGISFGTGSGDTDTRLVSLTPLNDSLVEGNETVALTLQNLNSMYDGQVSLGTTASAAVIDDNDTAALSIAASTTHMEESGVQNVVVTLSTSDGFGGTATLASGVSLSAEVVDAGVDTATELLDYAAVGTQFITFAAGSGDGDTQNATVDVLNDSLIEGDEFLTLMLQNLADSFDSQASLGTIVGTVTIDDNDTATVSISGTPTIPEEGGATTLDVTLTTSDGSGGTATLAPGILFTADVVPSASGTATDGSDYSTIGTQVVSFTTDDGDGTVQTVSVTPINDTLVEGNETVGLTLQNLSASVDGQVALGTTQATVTIDDNDTATISVAAATTFSEAVNAQTVVVTLTTGDGSGGPATLAPGVNVIAGVIDAFNGTAISGSDYTTIGTRPISFPQGSTDGDTVLALFGIQNDSLVEGNETIGLQLTALNSTYDGQVGFGTDTGMITIDDNDTATLSIDSPVMITEEGGTQTVSVRLLTDDGDGGPATLADGITLLADVADALTGMALAVDDYSFFNTVTVSFSTGDGNGTTQTVALTPVDDNVVEGNESIILNLENLNSTVDGQAAIGIGTSTVWIDDNDTATLSIESAPTLMEEGGAQTLTVTLTTSSGATLGDGISLSADIVDVGATGVGTATSTTDYDDPGTLSITFGSGAMTGDQQTVSLTPVNDALIEGNEVIELRLQNLSSSLDGQVSFGDSISTVTIDDNDSAVISISTGVDVNEEGGTQSSLEVQLVTSDGAGGTAVLAGGLSFQVDVIDGGGGTAVSGSDYVPIDTIPVVFTGPLGDGDSIAVNVTPLTDLVVEGNETLNLRVTNLSTTLNDQLSLGTFTGTASIDDNDRALLSIESAVDVLETGGSQDITVTLTTESNGQSGTPTLGPGVTITADVVDVGSGTATSGQDYSVFGTQAIAFAPGSINGDTTTVNLSVMDDLLLEGDETVDLLLQNLNSTFNGQVQITSGGSGSTVTIQDFEVLDFGDAPTAGQSGLSGTYPTLAINSGAFHVVGGPILGTLIDGEADGQPNPGATGDDNNGALNDEDGVQFVVTLARSDSADTAGSAVASAQLGGGSGFLNAWIDFNRDGDWDDAQEQVATDFILSEGKNLIPFVIPGGADSVAGSAFARFRVSADADVGVDGFGAVGEVEDYLVTIVDSSAAQPADISVEFPQTDNLEMLLESGELVIRQATGAQAELLRVMADSVNLIDLLGGGGTNDTLTLNFINGNPIPAGGVVFDGLPLGSDSLNLVNVGTTFVSTKINYENANDGTITLNDGTSDSIIGFRGLEPVAIDGTQTDVLLNLPDTSDQAVLRDDGISGNGLVVLESINGTFETTTFGTPTGSLTVNLLGGDDSIEVQALDSQFIGDLFVNGGDGNDFITATGTSQAVTASGGADDDTVVGSGADDSLLGGGGDDLMHGGAGRDTVLGQDGDDSVNGSGGVDTVKGGSGNDFLQGRGSNDRLFGGPGDDIAQGGAGRDFIRGDEGNDTILGQGSIDTLSGGIGDDRLDGGTAGTILFEFGDADMTLRTVDGATIFEGLGNDTFSGIFSRALLVGGDSSNILDASEFDGNVTLIGEGGNDTLLAGIAADILLGEDGTDTIRQTSPAGMTLTPTTLSGFGIGGNTIDSIEMAELTVSGAAGVTVDTSAFMGSVAVTGSDGPDTILTGPGNDTINAGDGADLIDSGDGDDTVNGDDGRDTIDGGLGSDNLNGGADDDTLTGGAGDDRVDGGTGSSRLVEQADADLSLTTNGGRAELTGAGDDTYAGNFDDAVLTGGASDNRLDATGFSGSVTLDGGAGNDSLTGGSFDDLLIGGEGTDRVEQTSSNLQRLTSSLLQGRGDDALGSIEEALLKTGNTGSEINAQNFTGATSLIGGDGDDTLKGGSSNDLIFGGNGNDVIRGFAGDDTLSGGEGNDQVEGGLGNDTALGGAGDDLVLGDEGADVVLGEDGDDTVDGGADVDQVAAGGNGSVVSSGDLIIGDPSEIDEALTFDFDSLILGLC